MINNLEAVKLKVLGTRRAPAVASRPDECMVKGDMMLLNLDSGKADLGREGMIKGQITLLILLGMQPIVPVKMRGYENTTHTP